VKFIYPFLSILSCIIFGNVLAQNYSFTPNCVKAYENIIALKIDSGKYYIAQEKSENPTNSFTNLLENYIDFLEVYTSGSTNLYEEVKRNFDKRINLLKNTDKDSPYYLYTQAEIHTQAAVLHIKFGEYLACIFDVKKALKKLENNQQKFPDFIPNYKSLGMLYTILGSIPQQYQGGLDFIGLKGEVNKGLNYLQKSVADTTTPFQHEAATVYAFMMLHIQNDAEKAWQVLKQNNFSPKNNLMDAFAYGHIGIYGTHNDEGIKALIQRPRNSAYISFPLTDFLIGIGKTHRQDGDANIYFKLFLSKNKGEDYIKSSWHKMAWNELIKGNNEKYKLYLANINTQGRAIIDADKQAEKESKTQHQPHPVLLKARLLTDGNYLNEALEVLAPININDFTIDVDKTEFFYRLARIYDKNKEINKAIQYYKITISNGQNIPYYYAANSAYLLGFLFEELNNKPEALKYYNKCLNLNGYEYENSIHQKAEAGLNRLNN